MTLNFGHKILITFILFGGFIFYLVYRTSQVNVDLVTKDYYEEELKYQEVIDASKNASALAERMTINQEGNKIVLQLPQAVNQQSVKGTIHFYCPANAAKDRELVLATDAAGRQDIGQEQQIPAGAYRVKVSWTAGKTAYYQETYLDYHP
jgi:nitrogen fixation protein FixH